MDEHATRTRRAKKLRPATAYDGLRDGIDAVVRRGARCFIVDPWGEYAEIEVESDQLSPEGAERLRALQEPHRSRMIRAIVHTGYLSREGKAERLFVLGVPMRFEVAQLPQRQDAPAPGTLAFKGTRRRWP
jgi:hypothetical protein